MCVHMCVCAVSHALKLPVGANTKTSVHLKAPVDVAYEGKRGQEGDGAQHEGEDHRGEQRVAEELHTLHGAAHARAVSVVEDGVDEDEDARGARAEHAAPPPAVVLTR